MLRLYDARSRLFQHKRTGALDDSAIALQPLNPLIPQPLLILPDSLDVQTAHAQTIEAKTHAFLVSRNETWLGIVRKESLEIIHKSNRFEAMQLPLTSIMLRSFILIPDSCTLIEAADEFVTKRALGAVMVSEDGAPVNVISVDYLEKLLDQGVSTDISKQPDLELRQFQRA